MQILAKLYASHYQLKYVWSNISSSVVSGPTFHSVVMVSFSKATMYSSYITTNTSFSNVSNKGQVEGLGTGLKKINYWSRPFYMLHI